MDTCSDISLARRDALGNLSSCRETVEHLGGETMFEQSGVFSLDGPDSGPFSVTLSGVFAVEPGHLPEGFVALLGVSDLRSLSISLDFVMANPGCDWRSAYIVTSLESVFRTLGLGRLPASPITEALPARSPVSGPTPPRPPASGELLQDVRDGLLFNRSSSSGGERVDPPAVLLSSPPVGQANSGTPSRYVAVDREPFFYGVPLKDTRRDPDHKGKWYAIRRGREIGVVSSWERCQPLVKGFPGAEYRSFWELNEARSWVLEGKREVLASRKQCRMQVSSFAGGKALRALVDVVHEGCPDTLQVLCCLDSGADINLASRSLLHDVHSIVDGDVTNCGDETVFLEEGMLHVSAGRGLVSVPALVASAKQLPAECGILLGVPGLDLLGVRLDAHRGAQRLPLECHVGERTLRTWLEANSDKTVTSVPSSLTEVDINPALPPEVQERIRRMLHQYEHVFAGELDTLPKPFAAENVTLKFVDNPVPTSVPEPRWTLAQKQILTQWAEEGLKNGSLELSTSRWSSRSHIVMKTPAHTHKDVIDIGKCKLRVCGDYRLVNQQIVKIVPNLPTSLEEVEKAAGHAWYWETDAQACYSQFVLSPGPSREALAVWSPIGLVQPTTLPFGQKNSGTEAQSPYRAAANELNKGRHGNYVDDWIGYSNSLDQLCDDFEVFLQVCLKYNITLGPHKTRFGYAEAQFFGFRVNREGSHLALKHLDPIRQLLPPTDIHEAAPPRARAIRGIS